MSEIQPIRILHFSDFHLNKNHEEHAEKLLSNMLKAIKANNKPIDLVIFSGDMIDQGGKSYGDISVAFERFKEIVIDKICDQLNISSERFVFTPGNHDIDGTKINPEADIGINQIHMTEEGKVHEYITTKSIFEREYPGRIQSVKDFEKLYYETLSNVQYTQGVLASNFVFSINGIKIGVSSLNTIWRCNYAKEKSEFNPIILGMDQISDSSDLIEECAVKFAVTHFDYDYLPEFEKDHVKDMIANNYDVLFTGHTHSTHVQSIMTSKGQKFLHLKSAGTLDCNRYSTHIDYQNAFQILTYYLEDHIEIIVYKQIDGQLFSQDMNFGSSGVYSEEIPKRKVNVTKTSNASIPQFELLTPILKKV